jgi:hypothetical protein
MKLMSYAEFPRQMRLWTDQNYDNEPNLPKTYVVAPDLIFRIDIQ